MVGVCITDPLTYFLDFGIIMGALKRSMAKKEGQQSMLTQAEANE